MRSVISLFSNITLIKSYFIGSILGVSLLLSGCGSSSSGIQTISFDGFSVDISTDFTTLAKGLVENKQLINKVVYSSKITNEAGFDTNFIITKSSLPPTLDYEQFWTANTNKLKAYVQGYTPGTKEIVKFSCKDEKITGLYVTFSVTNSLMQKGATYYMAQYQFVAGEYGYILSYATSDQKAQDDLEKSMKKITCL